MVPAYLLSACVDRMATDLCFCCPEAVKQNPQTGRWFITMGHPGFNSNANNGGGYGTRAAACSALSYYGRNRRKAGRAVEAAIAAAR